MLYYVLEKSLLYLHLESERTAVSSDLLSAVSDPTPLCPCEQSKLGLE